MNISINEKIKWSDEIIKNYHHKLYNYGLYENKFIFWNEKLVEEIPIYFSWSEFSKNENINWTQEFIQKHEKKWNWRYLSKIIVFLGQQI